MRRLIALLFISLLTLPVFAQDANVQITSPEPVSTIQGTVDIVGTVNPPDLQSYFFEVADANADPATASWTPVTLPSRTAIVNGTLAQFATTMIPDGTYTLRVRVIHQNGESTFATVGPLRIANGANSGQPVATATSAAPPEPTIVPRPNPVNQLPIPVGGQLESMDESAIPFMQEAGMTWIKWQIPFTIGDSSLIIVARDRINFSHQNGMNAMLSIKGNKDELAREGIEAYAPLYAEFVGQIAALQPDAIQVWNEQNLDREWPQGEIDPRNYVEMLRQAYQSIKAVDPTIKVITGAPAPTGAEGAFGLDKVWNDDRYYMGMANAGAAQYTDCLGIHYNEGIVPPSATSGDPRPSYPTYYLPSMMQRAQTPFGPDQKLCFSELGYVSPDGYGGSLPPGFEWGNTNSAQEQAQWLAEAIQVAAQTGDVDLLIVFNVNLSQDTPDPQAQFAIIRPDGTCPACETIGALKTP
jgi:hypothetical protein